MIEDNNFIKQTWKDIEQESNWKDFILPKRSDEKFWDEDQDKKTRIVHPLALKESRYRWYLVALDEKDSVIKSFALDRISNIINLQRSLSNSLTFLHIL